MTIKELGEAIWKLYEPRYGDNDGLLFFKFFLTLAVPIAILVTIFA